MNLDSLREIDSPRPIASLNAAQVKALQAALALYGYPVGIADGLIGPRTRNAWAEFRVDVAPGDPDTVEPSALQGLQALADHAASCRNWRPTDKDRTIAGIIEECRAQGLVMPAQIAYVLATMQWETAHTFRPVREAFWIQRAEAWRKTHLPYYPYYGRGYVQLTWKDNYERYAALLGIDLVRRMDLALEPGIARFILVHGFKTGIFTGRKIGDYINQAAVDFIGARRCINGSDKADEIAELAKTYLALCNA